MGSNAGAERRTLVVPDPSEACRRLGNACIHVPELVDAFGTFALFIRTPEAVGSFQLTEACRRVYEWAENRSHLEIAALFAEAAAIMDPQSPTQAYDAARLNRQTARFDGAAHWYERALGLAIRTKNRGAVINALLGYGNLMKDLGQFAKARTYYERVAQRALNTGRRRVAAEAHHSLLTLAAETGMFRAAIRHVRKALDYYPLHHPYIPYLVHDFAFVLVRHRFFALAIGPLLHLLSVIQRPHEQVLVYGTIARAAGGLRRRDQYADAAEAILRLVAEHQQYAASAMNGLAEAAWAFGEWDQAEVYAAAALTYAHMWQAGAEQGIAERLLDSLARREQAPTEMDPEDRERVGFLVQRLLSRLRAWEAPSATSAHEASHASVAAGASAA
ncbi:MAG TPA: tetratricopeptide repeat protein [Longimicrobiaceae bacterium]|nr:tetratricopeptide repeat protein [Longimicrobiaceae bacterium]